MKAQVAASKEIVIGEARTIDAAAPVGEFGVVFEDDGSTGYFYALDFRRQNQPIVDAMHIYAVEGVSDRHLPSTITILWTLDGTKAALLINQHPHAAFDFEEQKGYCRDCFPPPAADSDWERLEWDDSLRTLFV